MNYAELSKYDDKALVHYELQLERDLIDVSFRHRTGQLDDVSQLGKLRRQIAQARTAQRERERQQSLAKNALRDQHRPSFKPEASAAQEGASGGFMAGIANKLGKGDE